MVNQHLDEMMISANYSNAQDVLCHYARGVQTMAYSIRPKGGVSNKKLQASPEGLYFQITAQFLALKLIFTTSQSPKKSV